MTRLDIRETSSRISTAWRRSHNGGLVAIHEEWRAKALSGALRRRAGDAHDWPPLNSTMLAGASARRFSVTQTNWGGPDLITAAPRHNWYYAELWESHLNEATLSVLHERTDLTIVQLSVEIESP